MNFYGITALIMLFLVSGCAVNPIASTQTNDSLVIALSGTTDSEYYLVDKNGKTLAKDQGQDRQLTFRLPHYADTQSCVAVIDKEGERLQDKWYRLPLLTEFRYVDSYKSQLERRLDLQRRQYSTLNKKFQNVKIKLEGHSAFANQRCHLPTRQPIPPMPITRCHSYNECLEEGGAICYSRFIGAEGCSLALKELNVSGMLASPGCAAVAARIAGDKYDMDDAFIDLLHGAADDVAGGLINSDSWLDNAVGYFVLGTNYVIKLDNARVCTNDFVQRYYGPKMVWREKVQQINRQPQVIKSQCESLIAAHNQYYYQLNSAKKRIQGLTAQLGDLGVVHDELSSRQINSPICDNRLDRYPAQKVVKRYLIGAGINNVIDKNAAPQVKVVSLTAGHPAILSGLQVGDVIVTVNNIPVTNMLTFIRQVQRSQGQTISLQVTRNEQLQMIKVKPTYISMPLQGAL